MPRRNGPGRTKVERLTLSDGRDIVVRSGAEKRIARQLDQAGVEVLHETQRLEYVVTHKYIPDFELPNGILVEVKGYTEGWASGKDRQKMLRVREAYPDVDLRIVWSSPRFASGRIRAGSKTTNDEWAQAHGFKTAVGEIPAEWLE